MLSEIGIYWYSCFHIRGHSVQFEDFINLVRCDSWKMGANKVNFEIQGMDRGYMYFHHE